MIGVILLAATLSSSGYHLPDLRLTPGVIAISDKETVCNYKTTKRPNLSVEKKRACSLYGIYKNCPGPDWELDHLISRELGGADDVRNLWPQPIREAKVKDKVENKLHRLVCSGKMSLLDAQRGIVADWTKFIK